MPKRFKASIYIIATVALLAGLLTAGLSFAKGTHTAAAIATASANPGKTVSGAHATDGHVTDPSKIAGGSAIPAWTGPVKTAPSLPYTSKARLQAQRSARPSANAPKADASLTAAASGKVGTNTPFQTKNFNLLNNGCNPGLNGGFQFFPADLAVATSSSWIVEAVNNCIAVYNTSGTIQAGWPKATSAFFGVPNLGACQILGNGHPFMSDPRAAYDPNTGKFYLVSLEAEGVFGLDACPATSKVWVAVSNSSDPRSSWTIHSYNVLDTAPNGTTPTAGDYPTLGFDAQGIYFAVNQFDRATGSTFTHSYYCGIPKANLGLVACFHFPSVTGSRTIFVDTMQPVMTEVPGYGPRAEYIVNTYNIEGDPFTSDCFTTSCTGMVVWSFSNLANWAAGGSSPHIGANFITNTKSYLSPPGGNDPGCTGCVETIDTRISGTPVYSAGNIWAAWGTDIVNFQDIHVAAVLWSQSRAELTDNNSGACPGANDICPDVSTSYQQMGYYFFEPNNQSASFPAIMTDAESNLFMSFDTSSSSLDRSSWFVSRRATFKSGIFHDFGRIGQAGNASNTSGRWGDYSAASYDGLANDHPWLCAQYTNGANNWGTNCVQVNYSLKYP